MSKPRRHADRFPAAYIRHGPHAVNATIPAAWSVLGASIIDNAADKLLVFCDWVINPVPADFLDRDAPILYQNTPVTVTQIILADRGWMLILTDTEFAWEETVTFGAGPSALDALGRPRAASSVFLINTGLITS